VESSRCAVFTGTAVESARNTGNLSATRRARSPLKTARYHQRGLSGKPSRALITRASITIIVRELPRATASRGGYRVAEIIRTPDGFRDRSGIIRVGFATSFRTASDVFVRNRRGDEPRTTINEMRLARVVRGHEYEPRRRCRTKSHPNEHRETHE